MVLSTSKANSPPPAYTYQGIVGIEEAGGGVIVEAADAPVSGVSPLCPMVGSWFQFGGLSLSPRAASIIVPVAVPIAPTKLDQSEALQPPLDPPVGAEGVEGVLPCRPLS